MAVRVRDGKMVCDAGARGWGCGEGIVDLAVGDTDVSAVAVIHSMPTERMM